MKQNKIKKTYKTVSEYAEQVLGERFCHETKVMLALYADCYEGLEQQRIEINGNPKGTTGYLSANEFKDIGKHLPEYNAFNPKMIDQIAEIFGEHARFRIAREGSVCIYVATGKRVRDLRELVNKISELAVDEFSLEGETKEFRLWWD